MADIVNLRRFRKARGRAEAADEAARNRTRFGRSAADRLAADDDRDRREARLDGHRLDPARAGDPGE